MQYITRAALSCVLLLGAVVAQAAYTINYSLAAAGRVSINIYNARGQVVRELLRADRETAGSKSVSWDGKDRDGGTVPNGDSCTWKLLQTPGGLKATYLLSLGSSYVPDPHKWWGMGPGCHGAPGAVATDGTSLYVAAGTTENIETCVLKQPLDGSQRLWSNQAPAPWDGGIAAAAAGGKLYMLGHSAFVDGRIAQYGLNSGFYWNAQTVWIYNAGTGQRPAAPVSGNSPGGFDVRWDPGDNTNKGRADIEATDLDAYDSAVVLAYARKDAIRWYDPTTGNVTKTVAVPSPEGIAIAANGTVYASTGGKIVQIVGDTVSDFAAGLANPAVMSVDNSNGTLLVYLSGSMQIARYSLSTGQVLNTYGAVGGRSTGIYVPTNFFNVTDLASDGAGGFFVAERYVAPRRVAHFDRSGNLLKEWYGGTQWASCALVDPADPTIVWQFDGNQDPVIMRIIVDYAHKTWKVHSTYNYLTQPNGWFTGCDPPRFELFKHNGGTYIAPCTTHPRILRFDATHWRLVPVTVCDNMRDAPAIIKSWAGNNQSYQWNDFNGDGAIQRNEVSFYPKAMVALACDPHVDKNGEYYAMMGDTQSEFAMYRRSVTWKGNVPTYQMPDATSLFTPPARMRGKWDPRYSLDAYHDTTTGDIYCGMNCNITGWCACTDAFLGKWSGATTEAWEVGGHSDGSTDHFRRFAGRTHGCSVLLNMAGEGPPNSNNQQNRSYVWDSDGLWVGGVMDTIDTATTPAWFYDGGAEWLSGTMCYKSKNGHVLLYTPWTNEVRVYAITGWNNWVRQSGHIMLAPPDNRD